MLVNVTLVVATRLLFYMAWPVRQPFISNPGQTLPRYTRCIVITLVMTMMTYDLCVYNLQAGSYSESLVMTVDL